MKAMSSAETRRAFLEFFESKGHRQVMSSSLVPGNDPTLLFANSGMVQFKELFLGVEQRDYTRATTAQKVMRVSGKHNDLEEVGPSRRHHTFFEMLGNFSFGDYFKLEAMHYAWELLTEVYELPVDRLAVTIYEKDDESYDLWTKEIGVSPKRIARLGAKDNFWQMAETGPCGPNSEIHWDRTPELGEDGIIESLEKDDGRFMEIWNLVFMQFNRTQPDPDQTGEHDVPLPSPGVDTGMGFERMLCVLQGAENNYETDVFTPIIRRTQELTGHSDDERDANIVPYRVIADHARAAVFLISDGVLPGPKGRDSVARLVIRRAARFGTKIGLDEPFMAKVAGAVIDVMGEHYTDIVDKADAIKRTITREEERFHRTMTAGVNELETLLDELPEGGTLPGDKAFYLKATLGLPFQVMSDIAEERGYSVDMDGYHRAEEAHSVVSGGGQAMGEIEDTEHYAQLLDAVDYMPYGPTRVEATLVAVLQNGQRVTSPSVGDRVELVLDRTPFYVESGGQVSDTGTLTGDGWEVEVEAMRQPVGGLVIHIGELVEGMPSAGDDVVASVDAERRADITRNHTGTHLLHAALRNRLGAHVQQRGSLVAPERLRFDFAHDEKVSDADLRAIEAEVNALILRDYPVRAEYKSLQQAKSEGAVALFGEKYSDNVRTIIIEADSDRYSYELCGGVHVDSTADIGLFVFVNEGSVSAGVRRVEALTGQHAIDYVQEQLETLGQIAGRLQTTPAQALAKLDSLNDELQTQRKEIERLRRDVARADFEKRIASLEDIGGVPALVVELADTPVETLREMADWFRGRVDSGVFVAGVANNGKPLLLVSVTKDLTGKGLHAGTIVREAAQVVGGGGGGRPEMAQAGGKDAAKLPDALAKAREVIAASVEG
jgi:alanyl-tRNA synthetase